MPPGPPSTYPASRPVLINTLLQNRVQKIYGYLDNKLYGVNQGGSDKANKSDRKDIQKIIIPFCNLYKLKTIVYVLGLDSNIVATKVVFTDFSPDYLLFTTGAQHQELGRITLAKHNHYHQ